MEAGCVSMCMVEAVWRLGVMEDVCFRLIKAGYVRRYSMVEAVWRLGM